MKTLKCMETKTRIGCSYSCVTVLAYFRFSFQMCATRGGFWPRWKSSAGSTGSTKTSCASLFWPVRTRRREDLLIDPEIWWADKHRFFYVALCLTWWSGVNGYVDTWTRLLSSDLSSNSSNMDLSSDYKALSSKTGVQRGRGMWGEISGH